MTLSTLFLIFFLTKFWNTAPSKIVFPEGKPFMGPRLVSDWRHKAIPFQRHPRRLEYANTGTKRRKESAKNIIGVIVFYVWQIGGATALIPPTSTLYPSLFAFSQREGSFTPLGRERNTGGDSMRWFTIEFVLCIPNSFYTDCTEFYFYYLYFT